MGLKEQQDLLAKIYTDRALRKAFLADPHCVGARAGLSGAEIDLLSAVPDGEIDHFSGALISKRAREVQKLLPATTRRLAAEFETHFRRFAASFNSQSIRKHLDDAIEFCRFIREQPGIPDPVRDAARFETAKLAFFAGDSRIGLVTLKYEIEDPVNQQRRSLVVWLRFRGRVRRFHLG